MRLSIIACLGIVAALVGGDGRGVAPQTDDKTPKADQERIQTLIGKLGSPNFKARDQATRDLEQLGPAALELLRKATKSADQEVHRRAEALVEKIQTKLLTDRMLAPKRLWLAVNDVPVAEAVAQLAKRSGYSLEITGDPQALLDRKITLDTGETTFWQALEQLCDKAGLHDLIPVQPGPAQGGTGGKVTINIANLPKVGAARSKPNPVPPLPGVLQAEGSTDKIVLADGKAPEFPIHLAGSVRVRAVPGVNRAVIPAGEIQIQLDASAEPRLQDFGIIGSPFLEKAVDDQGQILLAAPAPDAPQNPNKGNFRGNGIAVAFVNGQVFVNGQPLGSGDLPKQRSVLVRLKRGEQPAKSLKELSGSLIVQALKETEALVTVDNILKAAGKTLKGKDEHQIEIVAAEKLADGAVKIQLIVQRPVGQNPFVMNGPFAGKVVINGKLIGGGSAKPLHPQEYPKLIDAKGNVCAPTWAGEPTINNNQMTYDLIYRPQGEAAQLVLSGRRPGTFAVPFLLRNVPLP